MKGVASHVIVIVLTLIIALILLVIFWSGAYKMIPFLSNLADGIVQGIKGMFCSNLPLIEGLCKLFLGA